MSVAKNRKLVAVELEKLFALQSKIEEMQHDEAILLNDINIMLQDLKEVQPLSNNQKIVNSMRWNNIK
jgi:hypothetical protein